MFRRLIAGAIASCFVVGSANAGVLTWTLENVVFTDGGTLSGSFDFDASTNIYSNIAITTTAGTANPGATYGIPNVSNPGNQFFMMVVTGALPDFTGAPVLALNWANPLTDLGGAISILTTGFTFESVCSLSFCASVDGPANPVYRRLVSGTISSLTTPPTAEVPIPAALPLFLAGLAGIGLARRRTKSDT